MRRRLFIPLCIAAALTLAATIASILPLQIVLPGQAVYATTGHGCIWAWIGHRGDWVMFQPGVVVDQWAGARLRWTATLETGRTRWVQAAPLPSAAPGTIVTIPSKQISGVQASISVWAIFPLSLIPPALCWPAWRSARWHRAGRCGACGYDLRGLHDRCPECGRGFHALLTRLTALIARARAA